MISHIVTEIAVYNRQASDGAVYSTAFAGFAAGNSTVCELQFTVIFEYDNTTGRVVASGSVEVYYGDRTLTADNIVLLLIAYPCVKAFHELGHAYVITRWGGTVHEIGIMFLVFMPVLRGAKDSRSGQNNDGSRRPHVAGNSRFLRFPAQRPLRTTVA